MIFNIKGKISITVENSKGFRFVINPVRTRGNIPVPANTVFRVQDDKAFDLVLSLADRVGNPLGTLPAGVVPTWSTSDPSIVTVTADHTDPTKATVNTTGTLGTAQVSVSVTLPNSSTPLTGMLDLEVVAGDATSLSLSPGNLHSRTI